MIQADDDSMDLDPNMCDYCYQRPKFPPYDYCGRTCGARAVTVWNQATGTAVLCKQCNQRPVYRNHQFCGRNCANAWTTAHGQITSLGVLWPSSWNLSQQTVQGGGQPGQKLGGVRGFVKGLKDLVSPIHQTQQQQQQQTVASPTQQPPNIASSPAQKVDTPTALPTGMSQYPSSLPSLTNGGILDQSDNNWLGPFNGAYHISQPPIQSTSSGSSVPQVPGGASVSSVQTTSNAIRSEMDLPSYLPGSPSRITEPDYDSSAGPIPGQTSHPDRDPGGSGDGGGGGDELVVGSVDVDSIKSSDYPPSISASESVGICGLEGCSNPTFVDSITDFESEYCSQKHHEEAMVSKQAASCIMCRGMPRGSDDHFCSTGCRERALCP